jgi:antirestriction protein ArdC
VVLLGDRLEIGSEIESHAAYLGHWVELRKESHKLLSQLGETSMRVGQERWLVPGKELALSQSIVSGNN